MLKTLYYNKKGQRWYVSCM